MVSFCPDVIIQEFVTINTDEDRCIPEKRFDISSLYILRKKVLLLSIHSLRLDSSLFQHDLTKQANKEKKKNDLTANREPSPDKSQILYEETDINM